MITWNYKLLQPTNQPIPNRVMANGQFAILGFYSLRKNEANDWNLLVTGWWIYYISTEFGIYLFSKNKKEKNEVNLLLYGWWI